MKRELQDIYCLVDEIEARLNGIERGEGERGIDVAPPPRLRQPAAAANAPEPEPRIFEGSPAAARPKVMKTPSGVKRPQPAQLEIEHLQAERIYAFDGADSRSRPYDMLRAQLLQVLGRKNWQVVGVTSPTPGCGKTLTALNLAFSAARQRDREVLLVDMDLRRPQIAGRLGIEPRGNGVLDLLRGRELLAGSVVSVSAGSRRLSVLPTTRIDDPSELMGGDNVGELMGEMRGCFPDHLIILDLPPVLTSDDVLALAPRIDCFVLVAAVGLSKTSEIAECVAQLGGEKMARVVVNKTLDKNPYY